MKTTALRLYGVNDVRLEEFELPEIKSNEILARVISDSLCMSSYKAAIQGEHHKRVPNDIATNPILLGHEFCGEIVQVGDDLKDQYKEGSRFIIQPAINYKGRLDAPGYSFPYIGGCATYVIIPKEVIEPGCLLPYNADAFFYGSLAEPLSCAIGSFEEFFHTKAGIHEHKMGIKEGGKLAILAGAGPMGIGAIDYIVHCDRKPGLVVVTDINQERLDRVASMITPEDAKANGVTLIYKNTACDDAYDQLMALTDGTGFDDVLVMAPVKSVIEFADDILGFDGCLSFFAGPPRTDLKAEVNFYDVHYNSSHIVGTVGGNTDDMRLAVKMTEEGRIHPEGMVTHVGGLNCTPEATLNLPSIPGGKKLIYTQCKFDLTAITDFAEKGKTDPMFAELAKICDAHNGLWCPEAEKYLLEHAEKI